jgi:Tol biopolymer transport system component
VVRSPSATVQLVKALLVATVLAAGAGILARPAPDAPLLTLTHIYSIRPDGTDPQEVAGGIANDLFPKPSPDGIRIAYERAGPEGAGLWVAGADGSAARQVAELSPSTPLLPSPAWSPNGQTIAFSEADYLTCIAVGLPCPNRQVWKVDDDGTNREVLAEETPTTRGAADPTWSPSGDQLAFVSLVDADGQAGGIDIADADGAGRHAVLSEASAACPAWSPDGRWIAYVRLTRAGSLRLISPDGRTRRRIHAGGCAFAWPPAGKRLAFVDRGWLYVISVTGARLRRLTRSRAGGVSWSPRGDAIAFTDGRQLAIVDVKTRRRRTLVRGCVAGPVWSRNDRIYFALTAPC